MNTPAPANGTSPAAVAPPHTASEQLSPMLQEIVDRTSDRYKLGLEPGIAPKGTLDAVWEIAQAAADAKIVSTVEEAFARIQVGRPLGLPAMASIQHVFLIESNGRMIPCMSAKSKLALCLSRPDIIEYIQPDTSDATTCVWVGKRVKGKEVRSEFTIEDARTAGLVDRGTTDAGKKSNNYTKHPKVMLSWRACGRLADMIGADILLGIATREELDDEMAQQRAEREELADAASKGQLAPSLATPPAQAKPTRDFAAEADALKAQLTDAIAAKSKPGMAAFRKAYDVFKAEAPAALSEDIQRVYAEETGKARKAARPDGAANGAPPVPPPSSPAATPAPAQAKSPAPVEPPPGAGDAWEAPADPSEPPFR